MLLRRVVDALKGTPACLLLPGGIRLVGVSHDILYPMASLTLDIGRVKRSAVHVKAKKG